MIRRSLEHPALGAGSPQLAGQSWFTDHGKGGSDAAGGPHGARPPGALLDLVALPRPVVLP